MATDTFINQLLEERAQKVTVIDNLAGVAAEEGRDLQETDMETITNYRSRIRAIDAQIDKVAGDLELADTVQQRIRHLDPSVINRDFQYRSAGEYLFDALNRHKNQDANGRWTKFHRRAAEHMGFDKSNTIATAGGFNGLIVDPNVGAVLNPSPSGRPLFSALGVNPITSANFLRPRIIDPNFLLGVGPQGEEKSELPSKAWDIVSDPVQATVVGGYINISELLVEMLPNGLDLIIQQMNRRLEHYTEVAAVTQMNLTTEEVELAADATSAEVAAALGTASATVFRNTGYLPTWIAMGADAWGRLAGLTDLAGRPMFPAVTPVNALGSGGVDEFFVSVAGLRAVVSHAITGTDMFVGNAHGLEVYERRLPILQATEPSVFGRQLSVQTMLAFYRPITAEAVTVPAPLPAESNGVVRIDWA